MPVLLEILGSVVFLAAIVVGVFHMLKFFLQQSQPKDKNNDGSGR